jgi:carbon-monoxide dehydrogenase large subunit
VAKSPVGALAAAINAVVDALQPYEIHHVDMPATQQKLWQIVNGSRKAAAE